MKKFIVGTVIAWLIVKLFNRFLLWLITNPYTKAALEDLIRDKTEKFLYGSKAPRPKQDRRAAPSYSAYRARRTSVSNPYSPKFHDVLLVAFDVRGKSAEVVQQRLIELMPQADGHIDPNAEFEIDAWWIADDVVETSDCDSAVFVKQGMQHEVRNFLRNETNYVNY